jgi:hypothetical protein
MGGGMIYYHKSFTKRKTINKNNNNKRGRKIINDLVCKQYINACELCAKLRWTKL